MYKIIFTKIRIKLEQGKLIKILLCIIFELVKIILLVVIELISLKNNKGNNIDPNKIPLVVPAPNLI